MAKKITLKVPREKGEFTIETGYVMIVSIGDRKVKFVMQDVGSSDSCHLTHYASGMKALDYRTIAARKLSFFVQNYGATLNNREACQQLINEVIDRLGAEKFLEKLDAAEVINA